MSISPFQIQHPSSVPNLTLFVAQHCKLDGCCSTLTTWSHCASRSALVLSCSQATQFWARLAGLPVAWPDSSQLSTRSGRARRSHSAHDACKAKRATLVQLAVLTFATWPGRFVCSCRAALSSPFTCFIVNLLELMYKSKTKSERIILWLCGSTHSMHCLHQVQ